MAKSHLNLTDFIKSMIDRAELERVWQEAIDEKQMAEAYEEYQKAEESNADPEKALRLLLDKQPLDHQVGGDHYKRFKIQPIEFCYENNIPFAEGNAIKYICRWRFKDGVKDLEKAKHILEMLIQMANRNAPDV
jgi:hypothetical protein